MSEETKTTQTSKIVSLTAGNVIRAFLFGALVGAIIGIFLKDYITGKMAVPSNYIPMQ